MMATDLQPVEPDNAMSLTVLSDDQIRFILESLDVDELDEFRNVLSLALHEFSTGNGASTQETYQLPNRTSTLHPKSKVSTTYVPACGPGGMGCKVISLTRPDAEEAGARRIQPTGVLNVFHPDGTPMGFLHARTLTAFRTALSSACLVGRRNHVRTITVFGSGLQAYWHVRLALMTRGRCIKHVNIINRRFSENAGGMLRSFASIPAAVKEREGWVSTKFTILTPTFHDYSRLQEEYIREADVIYCCTPSRQELFDGKILTDHEGRRKGRLIVAVGSSTPEMRELPEELLKRATKHEKRHWHFHKHAEEGGAIVVDTLEGAMRDAGEIISANIHPNSLVELGELLMLHRLAVEDSYRESDSDAVSQSSEDPSYYEGASSSMSTVYEESEPNSSSPVESSSSKTSFSFPSRKNSNLSEASKKKHDDSLSRWLRDGTVIYKSVGMGLMDLVVGQHLIKVANERQVGTRVPGF